MFELFGFRQALPVLVMSALILVATMPSASAGIVTTLEIAQTSQLDLEKDRLRDLLAREDVQHALESRGIDPLAAKERVNSMTDTEIRTMAAKLDQLPAGGHLNTTELLLIIILIILLI